MLNASSPVAEHDRTSAGKRVAIVGGGFTGLTAAWELLNAGCDVTIVEADDQVGGLAGGFAVSGTVLEKFYHHWFNNDLEVTGLVEELGLSDNLIERRTRTGMYYARSFFRLSKPMDLLKFTPLPFFDRVRLAALVFQARAVRDWRTLENKTAREWLLSLCGPTVYRVIWEPLMRGKFGDLADEISAVWLWNKLCLRGGSRDRSGNEVLVYYRGGFTELANQFAAQLKARGAKIITLCSATGVVTDGGRVSGVTTAQGTLDCDAAIFTTALPITAQLLDAQLPAAETAALRRIRYLANVCLVLRLDRSLSDLYWINVNDPSFPFVGVIEHTNFEPTSTYDGEHIVYLSRYLPSTDRTYAMSEREYLEFALPYIKRMFPAFEEAWIKHSHVWRAEYAQPVVERRYSSLIPDVRTSLDGAYIATMAQIYPEDRGTNYAIRSGREIGRLVGAELTAIR
jgi:protoporphyrinogen oxidase